VKTQNILLEGQRSLDIRDRETSVIGGNDEKWPCHAHARDRLKLGF
jgi:hypothetical protein